MFLNQSPGAEGILLGAERHPEWISVYGAQGLGFAGLLFKEMKSKLCYSLGPNVSTSPNLDQAKTPQLLGVLYPHHLYSMPFSFLADLFKQGSIFL